MTVYYIGPESKVWHARSDCRSLRAVDRYWPLHHANGQKAERIKRERRGCKVCVGRG